MIKHDISKRQTPIGYQVICICGWSRTFKKQNAWARAAKVRAAVAEHFREIEARETA
jgi:hypothetical protein